MTTMMKSTIDATRAASLACHTAAGLLLEMRKQQKAGSAVCLALGHAPRLLRSAESLSRQA
eukprot:9892404-Karenia_brevis.AAC.1